MNTITRFGYVQGGGITAEAVANYLPGNYTVVGVYESEDEHTKVLIAGKDNAGWTLDDYVIPRLASGLYFCWELVTPDDRGRDAEGRLR